MLTFFLFSLFLSHLNPGEGTVPKKEYHPPLNIPLVLAANFGELRPNHFHMGLDFKTNSKEGYTLHSIDEGYVSRVTISPYGYGRVVYINHPGGITSVYAHCQRLTGKLDERVKALQQSTQNSEADLYFQPNEIPLTKGEVFALSGNSGSSTGPHLHFEIRDTYTEAAINPLFLGLDITDRISPTLTSLKIYALDEFGYPFSGKEKVTALKGKGNEYSLLNGTLELPAHFAHVDGGIGFALNGTDRFNATWNSCGFYGTTVIVDGDTLMHQKLDQVPFEHTRYLNVYTDYRAYNSGQKFHKAFHSVSNPLAVYKTKSNGILKVIPGKTYAVEYLAFDFAGNVSKLKFQLKIQDGALSTEKSKATNDDYFNPEKVWQKVWNDASLKIPVNCSYEPFLKDAKWDGTNLSVTANYLPVVEAFTVRLKALSDSPIQQQYLAVKRSHGYTALSTQIVGDYLEASSKYFGPISIQVDNNGPYIKSVNVRAVVNTKKTTRLVWKMGDYRSGLMNYGLWIDGKWYVLDYESKGDYAFFELKDIALGTHEMMISAKDFCGNETSEKFTILLE